MKNGTRNFGLWDENFFQIVINSIDMVSTTKKQYLFKLPDYFHNKPTKGY